MGFLDNLIGDTTYGENVLPCLFRASILGGRLARFEDVTAIKSYKKEEIILKLKKGEIILRGKDLEIKRYSLCDVLITGSVTFFEVK